jgi:hypothetical protein
VRLEDEDVIRRQGRPERGPVEIARGELVRTAAAERRRVDDHPAVAQLGVTGQDLGPRGGHPGRVGELVRARRAERQDARGRRPEGRRPRFARTLGRAYDPVVVAVQEAPFRVGRRGQRVQSEALQGGCGVPDLDDRRERTMGRDVDGQIRVVDDHEPGGRDVDHAAHQAQEIAQLPGQSVAVRLQEEDDRPVGMASHDGVVDGRQVAIEDRHACGGQDDPVGMERQPARHQPDHPQEGAREQVFDAAHAGVRPAGGR